MAADEMNESEVKPKLTDLFTSDTFHEALNRPLAKEDIW